MPFGSKLKKIRLSMGLSQEKFAQKLNTTKQVISRYETEQRLPKITIVYRYANLLGVSVDELLYDNEDLESKSFRKYNGIPIIGNIACGTPILAEENYMDYINIPKSIIADFALVCHGDSMIDARIMDGDIVFIHYQQDINNGEIAAVLLENEATLKRVYKNDNCLILQPENIQYSPIVIFGEKLNEVKILGKAVGFMSKIK